MTHSNIKSTRNLLSDIKRIRKCYDLYQYDDNQAIVKLNNLTFEEDFYQVTAINENVNDAFVMATTSDLMLGLDDLVFYLEGTLAMLEDF